MTDLEALEVTTPVPLDPAEHARIVEELSNLRSIRIHGLEDVAPLRAAAPKLVINGSWGPTAPTPEEAV